MFVLSSRNGSSDPTRDKYYISLVEIKDFNALIDNNHFWSASKKKQEAYEKLIEMSRNNDSTTGNLIDFPYHKNYYKLIGIDLSRQTNTNIPQKITFVGKLKDDDDATMFFVLKGSKKQF